jgi:hypothetical protein
MSPISQIRKVFPMKLKTKPRRLDRHPYGAPEEQVPKRGRLSRAVIAAVVTSVTIVGLTAQPAAASQVADNLGCGTAGGTQLYAWIWGQTTGTSHHLHQLNYSTATAYDFVHTAGYVYRYSVKYTYLDQGAVAASGVIGSQGAYCDYR